jgi:subtilisin family serine protease
MAETQSSRSQRHMHPKLRQFSNCSVEVSSAKAEVHGSLKVADSGIAAQTPALAEALSPDDPQAKQAIKKSSLAKEPDRYLNVAVNVFVRSTEQLDNVPGQHSFRGYATRRLALEEIDDLASDPNTIFVEAADSLKPPRPRKGSTTPEPPKRSLLPPLAPGKARTGGKGVLIGIIDVEGFDWAHEEFMRGGKSRFTSIWDQGGDGTPPGSYDYGRVISAADMAQALTDAGTVHVSPHDLEPQSQMVVGSHGTHVASIAAGANGVCPDADIAAVLIDLPDNELERRTSFYDSTRLLDAIYYLFDLAAGRPISINISLGTNGHAHDGSSVLDRWIDALLAEPGRSICVAAGNAGQERPEAPGDLGYMMGRIHAGGTVAAQGLGQILEWEVYGDGVKDASENEMEIWFEPQDHFAVSLKPPGGTWIGPVAPGEFLENFQLPDRSLISIYNELHHPANGSNYAALYLTPFVSSSMIVGVPSGTWQVQLDGITVRDGRFHAWIERDDPADLGDGTYYWPSFFSQRSHVDTSTVSSLACGQRVISVANLDEGLRAAHITSSQGPTRDNREKPDIIAPGTDVIAANGFGEPSDPWISMTGTSMASPFVAGVAGLMLEAEPRLTAAQLLGIIKATARPLPGASYGWVNDTGFGVIDPVAAVAAAKSVMSHADIKARFKPPAAKKPVKKSVAKKRRVK